MRPRRSSRTAASTSREAVERVRAVAERAGVELVDEPERRAAHGRASAATGRSCARSRGCSARGVPVIGVNFGRVGFLASIEPERLEEDLARVFAGDYLVVEQPTLEARLDGEAFVAVNDVVATSSTLGRMVELGWAVGARTSASSRATG